MTDVGDDRDLQGRFTRLRREEAARPPTFARTLAAARSRIELRARRWVSAATVALIAAGIALAIWLVRPSGPSDRESTMDVAEIAFDETSIGTWGGPTDELLDVPGMDLLGDVPALGQDGYYDLEFSDELEPQARPRKSTFVRRPT